MRVSDERFRRSVVCPDQACRSHLAISLGTWIFSTTISSVFGGLDFRGALVGTSSAEAQFVVFVAAAASAVYYAMFAFAPRQVAASGGLGLYWLLRYALYLAGLVLNLAFLRSV